MSYPCIELENFIFNIFGNHCCHLNFAAIFQVKDGKWSYLKLLPLNNARCFKGTCELINLFLPQTHRQSIDTNLLSIYVFFISKWNNLFRQWFTIIVYLLELQNNCSCFLTDRLIDYLPPSWNLNPPVSFTWCKNIIINIICLRNVKYFSVPDMWSSVIQA